MSMESSRLPVERLSAVEIWVYLAVAAVSVLTSPITAIFALVIGLVVLFVGTFWVTMSRSALGSQRGVRVLLYGAAMLAGPVLYLLLAAAVRLF